MDLQSFATDLFAAVLKVRSGPYDQAVQSQSWRAFSDQVLGASVTPDADRALHDAVSDWLHARKDIQGSIHSGGDWGYGRQDAMSMALNAVAGISGDALPAANAPVSIPSVWAAEDSLQRRVAEVVGHWAAVTLPMADDAADQGALQSSVRVDNLVRLQAAMASLPAPVWPREWGAIDRTSADYKAGKAIYAANCASCHGTGAVAQAPRMFSVLEGASAAILGTDPMAACIPKLHSTSSSVGGMTDLASGLQDFTQDGPESVVLQRLAEGADTARLLDDAALRILWANRSALPPDAEPIADFLDWAATQTPTASDTPPEAQTARIRVADLDKITKACADKFAAQRLRDPDTAAPGYAPPPLAGVFATAPYLHNGSVPSLDALLLPQDARPTEFETGAVRFDPVKVGLGAAIPDRPHAAFNVKTLRGRVIAGNSNAGHAYPATPLTDVERAQLILYLKAL